MIKARTDSDDASNNDEDKRQWSRNVGVIGKKAPKKVTDVKIDFKKKNANLSFEDMVGGAEDEENVAVGAMPIVAGDVSGIGGPPAGLAPVEEAVAVKMPTRKELVATLAASGDAIHAPVAVTRRKKGRFHLRPLPTVKCSIFRGLSDPRNRDLVMKQAFALIFKIVSFSYGNREFVFQHGILEEISEIACLCQSLPQLLDYYIWIVDQVYSDGYGDEQNIVEELKDIDVIPVSIVRRQCINDCSAIPNGSIFIMTTQDDDDYCRMVWKEMRLCISQSNLNFISTHLLFSLLPTHILFLFYPSSTNSFLVIY